MNFQCRSIFDLKPAEGAYDFVYDSGCLHHLPPHRRKTYVELVDTDLKPGGSYGLTCSSAGRLAGGLEKSWPGCRIGTSAFVEKVSGGRPGCR